MMRFWYSVFTQHLARIAILLFALLASIGAQSYPLFDPLIDRKTYHSPSGSWEVVVDPQEMYGRGPSKIEASRSGKPVWSKELPFTFQSLFVTDAGQMAGYAYTAGRFGGFENSDDVVVVIIAADGTVLSEKHFHREPSRIIHAPATPTVAELLVDHSGLRALIQLQHDPDERVRQSRKVWHGWALDSGMAIKVGSKEIEAAHQRMRAAKQVSESRKKSELSSARPKVMEALTLQEIRQVALSPASAASLPPFQILEFQFDSQGNIGFLQQDDCCEDTSSTFWMVNPSDGRFRSVPLPLVASGVRGPTHTAYLGGSRWMLFSPRREKETFHDRSELDTSTGKVVHLGKFKGEFSTLAQVTSFAGKGFAYLLNDRLVHCFTVDGQLKGISKRMEYSIESLSMREDGAVDVLEGVSNRVIRLAADCTHIQTIKLNESMDRKLNYVSRLSHDRNRGWLLHDFHGNPPVYKLSPNASVLHTIFPHFPDGRKIDRPDPVLRGPDGHLWTSDSAALLRLDDKGMVDKVLGPSVNQETLVEPVLFTVLPDGGYLVADKRNGWVHHLDREGGRQKIYQVEPGDMASNADLRDIFRLLDGRVVLSTGITSDSLSVEFNSDGSRLSVRKYGIDDLQLRHESEQARTQLAVGYTRAELRDREGRALRQILRRADGAWLGTLNRSAMSPDGRFAILSGRDDEERVEPSGAGIASLTFYDASGAAVRTIQLGKQEYYRLAFDGERAYLLNGNVLSAVDSRTGIMTLFRLSSADKNDWWEMALHAPTQTLHFLDPRRRVVRIVRLPLP